MASGAGTRSGAAYSYSSGAAYSYSSGAYTAVAAHQLTRQSSVPAALAAAFAPCAGGGHDWPGRLGDGGGGVSHGRAPAARAEASGVAGAVARLVRAWIGSRRRRSGQVALMSRSGSSAKERQQYGHEEYAQNFDEGAAAGEPENLARSFSVRYARQAPRDGARR